MNIVAEKVGILNQTGSSQVSKKRCPECSKRLRLYQITLDEAVQLCENDQCMYPLCTRISEELVIKRNIEVANKRKTRKRANTLKGQAHADVVNELDALFGTTNSSLVDCETNAELKNLMDILNNYASNSNPEHSIVVSNELHSLEKDHNSTVGDYNSRAMADINNLISMEQPSPEGSYFPNSFESSILPSREVVNETRPEAKVVEESFINGVSTVCSIVHLEKDNEGEESFVLPVPAAGVQPQATFLSGNGVIKTYSKVFTTLISNANSIDCSSQDPDTTSKINLPNEVSKFMNAEEVTNQTNRTAEFLDSGEKEAICDTENFSKTADINWIRSVPDCSANPNDAELTTEIKSSPSEYSKFDFKCKNLKTNHMKSQYTNGSSDVQLNVSMLPSVPKNSTKLKRTATVMATDMVPSATANTSCAQQKRSRKTTSPKDCDAVQISITESHDASELIQEMGTPINKKSLLSIATVAQQTCGKLRTITKKVVKSVKQGTNCIEKNCTNVPEEPHPECLSILCCLEATPVVKLKQKKKNSLCKKQEPPVMSFQEWNKFSPKSNVNKWLGNKLQTKQFPGYKVLQKKVHDSGSVSEDSGFQSPSSSRSDESEESRVIH